MEVCIVTKRSFLSCSTTQGQNHGAFNFTSLNDAFPHMSGAGIHSTDCTCSCQSPFPSLQRFCCLNCNFIFVFGKLWCSKARMSHNKVHCRTSFSHPSCLELLFVALIIMWAGSLVYSSIGEFILCLQTPLSLHNLKTMLQTGRYPWSLSLPRVRAAVRAFYWTQHDNSSSQRCLRVHSDNKSTVVPDKPT